MLTEIHHVQITIPHGQGLVAKAFYCQLLDLKETEKPDALKTNGGFWIQLGNSQLHIGTESGVDRSKTKAHIAYSVTDIDIWRRKLQANSIELQKTQPIPGFKRITFSDPFGYCIELVEKII